ncbi:nucleotidyltransferase family protein [Pararhodonellum marinum]|uniref:nucleotidyltransferase family protein n=1 Tax=Pararhodonellum marinum TaxID=2755358 RepID=UPI00188EE061|nr:nucleotidyltransferase family protein [Pararhodonellum marinum]
MTWTREKLYHRHRLSHRQIDDLLGVAHQGDEMAEKVTQLEKLRFFFQVAQDLIKANIWFVVLKGPLLSQRLYKDPTYRYYKDFDFLLNPEDVTQAIELLEQAGLKPLNFHWPKSISQQNKVLGYLNQINLVNEETGLSIELHWKLFHWKVVAPSAMREHILSNTEELTLSGIQFKVLSPEFELLYLIIHGGLHAWFRLKWLVDIQVFLRLGLIDVGKFKKLVRDFKAEKIVALAAALLEDQLQNRTNLGFQKYLDHSTFVFCQERLLSEHELPYHDIHSFRKHLQYKWRLFPNMSYKLSLLKFSTFRDKEVNHSSLPLHPVSALAQRAWDRIWGK